jgi:hypothetical protein
MPRDWALVVGIAKYPGFGDLQGPVHDADEVAEFLKVELNVANVRVITSQGSDGVAWGNLEPHPTKGDIENWIGALHRQSKQNEEAGLGVKVGRRLYLYFSGHGMARGKHECAIITSEALKPQHLSHVIATSWIENLCNLEYFDEYVLWMDCCSEYNLTLTPSYTPFPVVAPIDPQPSCLVVTSARFPGLSIERQIEDGGRLRGIFTHFLLQGLRGHARNPDTGTLTTKDLRGYLIAAMTNYMKPLKTQSNRYALEPGFIHDDEIDFARPALSPARRISVPDVVAEGARVRVLNSRRQQVQRAVVAAGGFQSDLGAGLYKLVWDKGTGLFEIVGHEDKIEVRQYVLEA